MNGSLLDEEDVDLLPVHPEKEVGRHIDFLRHYLGRPSERFSDLSQFMTIGLELVKMGSLRVVEAKQDFALHQTLSVEGDKGFGPLMRSSEPLATELEGSSSLAAALLRLPNARVHCLHYGNGTVEFPKVSLRVVLAAAKICKGELIIVCPRSIERCEDEVGWYTDRYGPEWTVRARGEGTSPSLLPTMPRTIPLWPPGVPYYHGVGERHKSAEAMVSFPYTLLNLQPCPALGPRDLEVTAALHTPPGMCFLYTGPVVRHDTVKKQTKNQRDQQQYPTLLSDGPAHEDRMYDLIVRKGVSCRGQGLMRYVNHRYNFSRVGNVELTAVLIPVVEDEDTITQPAVMEVQSKATPWRTGARRITMENNATFVNIPFFVTTTHIDVDSPLLANSYGLEFDARLERWCMMNQLWVPLSAATRSLNVSQLFEADYRHSIEPGSVVWMPQSGHKHTPWIDVYMVEEVMFAEQLILIRRLEPRGEDEKDGEMVHVILPLRQRGVLQERSREYVDTVTALSTIEDIPPLGSLVDAMCGAGCLVCCMHDVVLLLEDIDYIGIVEDRKGVMQPKVRLILSKALMLQRCVSVYEAYAHAGMPKTWSPEVWCQLKMAKDAPHSASRNKKRGRRD